MTAEDTTHAGMGPARFQSTLWTAVVVPAGDHISKEGQAALETLCRAYWAPLYWYVRRKGYSQHEAEDLTQSFFARLLQRNDIARASPEKGRFRSFLLASLENFLKSEWRARSALKRGGGFQITSLDLKQAEEQLQAQAVDGVTPETIFDRRWTMAVLDRVTKRLEAEYAADEKGELFAELKPLLTDRKTSSYAEIGKRHGLTANAVGVVAYRLRERFAEVLRNEVAQTVTTARVEDELRELIAVWKT